MLSLSERWLQCQSNMRGTTLWGLTHMNHWTDIHRLTLRTKTQPEVERNAASPQQVVGWSEVFTQNVWAHSEGGLLITASSGDRVWRLASRKICFSAEMRRSNMFVLVWWSTVTEFNLRKTFTSLLFIYYICDLIEFNNPKSRCWIITESIDELMHLVEWIIKHLLVCFLISNRWTFLNVKWILQSDLLVCLLLYIKIK